ncbi:hypothetical protein AAFC00_007066 [Neodothiora populina]
MVNLHKDGLAPKSRTDETDVLSTSKPGQGDVEKQDWRTDAKSKHENNGRASNEHDDTITDKKSLEHVYPPTKEAAIIMLGLYLAIFLVALDRTIIGTAIPKMTDEWHSFNDIGWYGSAYMITTAGFQLFFGKTYTYYSPKWVFLSAILLFEIGSAICGAAPSSVAFIIGRAISGVGCAGITSGGVAILMNVIPLHKRPMWMGLMGSMFGIASVVGPLLGGVFTSYATWRWCFYINLPIGAVTAFIVLLVLKVDRPMAAAGKSVGEKIKQLDPIGTLCFFPGIVCLLLALQWGGSTYAWDDGRIIALWVVFGVLTIAFILLQVFRDDEYVTLPKRVITNRSIAAGAWFTLCIGASMSVAVYYLPIYFQAIKGVDAVQSGIRSIPLVLALVVAVILTGIAVGKIGYYTPFMFVCAIITSIGFGLVCTLRVDSSHSKWIGFQVLLGLGLGCGLQQPNMAAQTVLPRKYASSGMALMFFCQNLGGSVFISVAQNVLSTSLIKNLRALHLSDIGAEDIANTGATDLRNLIPANELPRLLVAYNAAIIDAFYVGLAMACMLIVGALAMEWKSVKKAKEQQQAAVGDKTSEVDTRSGAADASPAAAAAADAVAVDGTSSGLQSHSKGDEKHAYDR